MREAVQHDAENHANQHEHNGSGGAAINHAGFRRIGRSNVLVEPRAVGPGKFASRKASGRHLLLPPPAVGDNAAMQAESPKAEPPKRKRRWFQFSLRTFLIFTAIVAVGCGWIGRRMEQKRREREVLESLDRLRVGLAYDYQSGTGGKPPGPEWLRKLLGENFFTEVESVSLSNIQRTNDGLESIKELSQVRRLWLSDCNVADVGLEHLSGLTHLHELDLSGTFITDAGLPHLIALTRLESLRLRNTRITDVGAQELKGLTRLQILDLRWTYVTDAGLVPIKELTNLKELWLSDSKVTDAGVNELQKALPNCQICR